MKSLFTVIIIFLLPLSLYGAEWTVKYEMTKTNGDIEYVTVSIPNELVWEIPYIAGKFRCTTSMYNSSDVDAKGNYFYSYVRLKCFLKENEDLSITSEIFCDTGWLRDTKENSMKLILRKADSISEGQWAQRVTLECKI